MRMIQNRVRGFTILELVVTISIIGILLALLLPAVQNAREASRRTLCKSNLKQLGLALHVYHDLHRCFPHEIYGGEETRYPYGAYAAWGWPVMLLPMLDQAPLFSALNPQGNLYVFHDYYRKHNEIYPNAETQLPVLRCPSSMLPETSRTVGPESISRWQTGYATMDYRGSKVGVRGMFFTSRNNPPRRMSHVRDGLGNTIAIGEGSHPGTFGKRWPTWVGRTGGAPALTFKPSKWCPINGNNKSRSGRYWEDLCQSSLMSFHTGGVQILMADGHVRFLNEQIDHRTLYSLCAISDGKVISSF